MSQAQTRSGTWEEEAERAPLGAEGKGERITY